METTSFTAKLFTKKYEQSRCLVWLNDTTSPMWRWEKFVASYWCQCHLVDTGLALSMAIRVTARPPKMPKGQAETARKAPILFRSRELPNEVQRDFESDPSHHFSVDSARPLHRLVAATEEFLPRKSDRTGAPIPLDVRVSKESQDRAFAQHIGLCA